MEGAQSHNGATIVSAGQKSIPSKRGSIMEMKMPLKKKKTHWALVIFNILASIGGQSAATLLNRYYFAYGGQSRWISTLFSVAGWPILLLPLLFYQRNESSKMTSFNIKIVLIYIALGVLFCGFNLLYAWGISYMPVSTFSILCSSQLAFTALFSYFLNKQKITFYIINSMILLTQGSVLLGIYSNGDRPEGVSNTQYVIGFLCTIGASILSGLSMPLTQLVLRKVVKKESYSVVLEACLCISSVASVITVVGLVASGNFHDFRNEAESFKTGKVAYWMTLLWCVIAFQVCNVGVMGLIFQVSALFSNVIGTVALPVVPLLSIPFFHDKLNASKIISLLTVIWGFISYLYGGYVDTKSATQDLSPEHQDESTLQMTPIHPASLP